MRFIINRTIIVFIFTLMSQQLFAETSHDHEEESHHVKAQVEKEQHDDKGSHEDKDQHGHDEASGAHDEEAGKEEFEMSDKALKAFGVKTVLIEAPIKGFFRLPLSSVLSYGEKKGVYKKLGKHFELIEVEVLMSSGGYIQFNSNQLKKSDVVVSHGVPLLRVAHLQATGQGGEGHAH